MYNIKSATTVFFILSTSCVLSNCASTEIVNDPGKIADTGKTNAVMYSYNVTVDVFDRHAEALVTDVLLCKKSSIKYILGINKNCLRMAAKFTGTKMSGSIKLEGFEVTDADIYLKKYGSYNIDEISYRVLIGHKPVQTCNTTVSKKTKYKTTVCTTEQKPKYNLYKVQLPSPIEYSVGPGAGCYLGHYSIHLMGDKLLKFEIENELDDQSVELLAEPIRDRVRDHMETTCMVSL